MDRWTGILKVPLYNTYYRVAASLCLSPSSKSLSVSCSFSLNPKSFSDFNLSHQIHFFKKNWNLSCSYVDQSINHLRFKSNSLESFFMQPQF